MAAATFFFFLAAGHDVLGEGTVVNGAPVVWALGRGKRSILWSFGDISE